MKKVFTLMEYKLNREKQYPTTTAVSNRKNCAFYAVMPEDSRSGLVWWDDPERDITPRLLSLDKAMHNRYTHARVQQHKRNVRRKQRS